MTAAIDSQNIFLFIQENFIKTAFKKRRAPLSVRKQRSKILDLETIFLFIAVAVFIARYIRQIFCSAARWRVGRAAARYGCGCAAVNTSGGQSLSVDSFDQNSRNFLRKRSMFGSSAAAQRFLQFVWNIRSDENPFSVCHIKFSSSLKVRKNKKASGKKKQIDKPNFVL
jgi:hypothetical protein